MIKNIVFDMGGVLIKWSGELLMDQLGVAKEDQKILKRELFSEDEWIAMDANAMSHDEVCEAIFQRIDERLHPDAEFLIRKWWTLPFVYVEGVNEVIEELYEKGYRIYLLSNADIHQKEYFYRMPYAKYFSGRVTSAEIGIIKPDRRIFEYLCDEYDLKKEESFFIDDSNSNVFAAKRFGMKACVFHDCESLRISMRKEGIDV